MLERFPNAKVILDHLAKLIAGGWASVSGSGGRFRLADYSNLYLKLTPRTLDEAKNGRAAWETFFPLLVSKFGA